jgi:hypothetical protein
MKIRFVLTAIFSLTISGSAFAQSFEIFDVAFGSAPVNGSNILVAALGLPEFDSNLGTLQGVTLTLTSTFNGSIFVYNNPPGPPVFQTVKASLYAAAFDSGAFPPPVFSFPSASVSGTVETGGSTFPISVTSSQSGSPTTIGSYEAAGGGSRTIDVYGGVENVTSSSLTSGPGPFSCFGDLKVDYTYAAIPEPATYATVLGVAALGLAAIRRKRQVACP